MSHNPQGVLYDNHGRLVNYLRLAVTDRCNLRCFYCMPEEGLNWLSRSALMSEAEMIRICTMLTEMGIQKIRITGGEPFARKDIMHFLDSIAHLDGLEQLVMTTNGVLTAPHVPALKSIGVHSVNLSLDTLDRNRFFAITHRDELPAVLKTLDELLKFDIEVKINAVVMDGKNTDDIISLLELGRALPVAVRFIEEMPFNGQENHYEKLLWDHVRILKKIEEKYPEIQKIQDPLHSTSLNYRIPGFKGEVGIIAAYTRSFCGSCNRIRITPQGMLKTCLYDDGVLNIRDLLREGLPDEDIRKSLLTCFGQRHKNGFLAEQSRKEKVGVHESMATIGG